MVVNSKQFKKDLRKKFNLVATCIYNPLNSEEIIKKSKRKSSKIFNLNNKIKIINIGRFTDQKNQIIFLKSLKHLKEFINFEAVIIGKGFLKSKLKKYIVENKLTKM